MLKLPSPQTTTINPLKSMEEQHNIEFPSSPPQIKEDQIKPKKKRKRERRSKDDNFERNFICGCGKSYLSYAALYTHAKTKHEGVFPEGTTTLHKKKQGRPKKDEWCATKINSAYQKTYDFNKDFQHYLEMIPMARDLKDPNPKNMINCFPCEIFKDQKHYEKILINMEQLRKELIDNYGNTFLNQIDIIIFEIRNIRDLNANEIFALFLIYIFRFVSKSFFKDLVFFIVCYKIMLNDKGWEICQKINDGYKINKDKDFCESEGTEFVPELSNNFINDYFIRFLEGNEILREGIKLDFFGIDSIKLLRVILFIKHFCTWLYIHKFTKGKIDIFKD